MQDKPELTSPEQASIIQQKPDKNDMEYELSNSDDMKEEQESGSAEQPGSGKTEQEQKYFKGSFRDQSTEISDKYLVKDVNLSNKANSTFRAEDYSSVNKSLSVHNGTVNRNENQYTVNEQGPVRQVFRKAKKPTVTSYKLKETNFKSITGGKGNPIATFSKQNVKGSLSVVKQVNENWAGKKMREDKHGAENRTDGKKIDGIKGKATQLAKQKSRTFKQSSATIKQNTQNHIKMVATDQQNQLTNENDSLHQAAVETQKKADNVNDHKTAKAVDNPSGPKETKLQRNKPFSGLHSKNKALSTQNKANKDVKTKKKRKFVKLQKQTHEHRLFKNVSPKQVSKGKNLLTHTTLVKKPVKLAHGPIVTTNAVHPSRHSAEGMLVCSYYIPTNIYHR